jgi:hypothetical protein
LVERDLAKVEVAGSSPVFRSKIQADSFCYLLFFSNAGSFAALVSVYSGGGTGRHAGLKILFAVRRVWVQLPSRVLVKSLKRNIVLRFRLFCFIVLLICYCFPQFKSCWFQLIPSASKL